MAWNSSTDSIIYSNTMFDVSVNAVSVSGIISSNVFVSSEIAVLPSQLSYNIESNVSFNVFTNAMTTTAVVLHKDWTTSVVEESSAPTQVWIG